MSLEQTSATKGLVNRVKGILIKPDEEWVVIDAEPATVKGLFTGYAVILAAIGPAAGVIGAAIFGLGLLGLVPGLVGAVVGYVLSLVGVFVISLIIDALAPTFGSTKDRIQATKVAVYSATAAWVAGIFGLFPPLFPLVILASLYSLWLFYRGLPKLMKTPDDKALPYVAVVILIAVVVQWVIGLVAASIVAMSVFSAAGVMARGDTVRIGDATINTRELETSAKALEAQAKQMQAQLEGKTVDGTVIAVPADTLKALLPASVAGFNRTAVESSSGGIGGLQGSNAQGEYAKGDATFTLNVTDMAAAGGLAGMAGAFNVSSNRETATGYEKMGKVDGRMTTENYDRSSRAGEYSVLVANRFMVQAQGSNVSMDELKAAVSAVGLGRLDGLAKG